MELMETEQIDSDDEIELTFRRRVPKELLRRLDEEGIGREKLKFLFFGPSSHRETFEIEKKKTRHFAEYASSASSGYSSRASSITGPTPQNEPLHDRQVRNNAGGFVFKVDDMVRLRRIICLGTEKGTYYVSAPDLTKDATMCVVRLLDGKRGEDVVQELVKFASLGRVAKLNTLIYILAICANQSKDLSTKRLAYKSLSKVCTIPTHLFMFTEYYRNMLSASTTVQECEVSARAEESMDEDGKEDKEVEDMKETNEEEGEEVKETPKPSEAVKKPQKPPTGWGRAHRIGIANYYLNYKDNPWKLAMHVTKYKQRNGWTHRDLIKLSHPKPDSERGSKELAVVVKYVVKGLEAVKAAYIKEDDVDETKGIRKLIEYMEATEVVKLKTIKDEQEICDMIRKHNLVREHLPTQMLNSVPVWRALLRKMPVFALVRNLGKMSSMGMFGENSEDTQMVTEKLTNRESLRYAKMHPFNIFLALKTYQSGHGHLGSLRWTPNSAICQSLEDAFYKSFDFVEPTKKRFLLALDISPSMDGGAVNGCNIVPREGVSALAMVTARTEPNCDFVGFAHEMTELEITKTMSLSAVMSETRRYCFGGTDASLPALWAAQKNKQYDAIIIYTDNETWSGRIHASEALKKYRSRSGIHDCKMIVVALTSTGFSIADPDDPNMLDMVGFDTNGPEIIRNFVLGNI